MKKLIYLIVLIVILGFIVTGCLPVVPPTEQGETSNLTKGSWNVVPGVDTIQAAITAATSGDTIYVAAGIYNEGIITIDKNLKIIGATSKPIINPTTDTGTANAIGPTGRGWFQIHNGATVTFKNLVFDGTGKNIYTAVHYHSDSAGGTVENCDFMNIKHSQYQGRGINNYDTHVVVLDCTFTNIQRIGVFTYNPTADTLIKGCTYTGKGAGDWLDYAFEVGGSAAITVEDCTITECRASGSGWGSAGILVTSLYGPTPQATITGNDIHSNSGGVVVGYGDSDSSTVILTYNDIHKNDVGVYIRSDGTTVSGNYNNISNNEDYGVEVNPVCTANYDFTNNWWGHPSGPGGEGGRKNSAGKIIGKGDAVSYLVDWDPWLSQPITPQQIANKWDLKGSFVAHPTYNWGGLAEGATWEYSIHIKEAISGEFSVGSIHFATTVDNIGNIEVTGIVEQTKSDYAYWSTPNLAAAGRAEYDGVMYNFLFLYNEDNMWFALSQSDLEPSWTQETVWPGSLRKYQLHSKGLYEPMDPKNIH